MPHRKNGTTIEQSLLKWGENVRALNLHVRNGPSAYANYNIDFQKSKRKEES